jgi:hypothetical protein
VFPYDLDLLVKKEPITSKGVKAVTTSNITTKNAKHVPPPVQPIQDCNGAPIATKARSVSHHICTLHLSRASQCIALQCVVLTLKCQ